MDAMTKGAAPQPQTTGGPTGPRFELLQWHPPLFDDLPDADITMACWTAGDGLFAGHWDDGRGQWIDDASGAAVADQNVWWANPEGPLEVQALPPAEVPVHQVRAALAEALDLLNGWIDFKCAKQHRAEHRAVVNTLAKAGGL